MSYENLYCHILYILLGSDLGGGVTSGIRTKVISEGIGK